MHPKLNFLDRLLGRTTKDVVEKDRKGQVIEKKTYSYDQFGGIINLSIERTDQYTGILKKYKNKTYVRRENGSYDPVMSVYYDSEGRQETCNQYYRDSQNVLCCEQKRYQYTKSGEQCCTHMTEERYEGGRWNRLRVKENYYDQDGHLMEYETFEFSPYLDRLARVKNKTYVLCEDGSCDPKESMYYNQMERLIKTKKYTREQTELQDKPVLFATETDYEYDHQGIQTIKKSERFFHIGGNFWGTMADFDEAVKTARKLKTGPTANQAVKQSETEVAQAIKAASDKAMNR